MRNLIVSMAALVAIAACGPSGRDVALAKTARYQGDKLAIFAAAKEATESKYKLEQSDETTLTIQTIAKWYTADGLVSTWDPANPKEDKRTGVEDTHYNLRMLVKLAPDADKYLVVVEPTILRFKTGRPNADKLDVKDPSIPGWATSKVDELAFDIHNALGKYEVKKPIQPLTEPGSPSSHGY
jgi:hypothetical protein